LTSRQWAGRIIGTTHLLKTELAPSWAVHRRKLQMGGLLALFKQHLPLTVDMGGVK
jgi:hypothetical protein